MKILHNGRYFVIETQDDWDEFKVIRCNNCGHPTMEHEYHPLDSHTYEVERCKNCACSQFKKPGVAKKFRFSF